MKKKKAVTVTEIKTKDESERHFRVTCKRGGALRLESVMDNPDLPQAWQQHPKNPSLEVCARRTQYLGANEFEVIINYDKRLPMQKGESMETKKVRTAARFAPVDEPRKNIKFEKIPPDEELLKIIKEIQAQNRMILQMACNPMIFIPNPEADTVVKPDPL